MTVSLILVAVSTIVTLSPQQKTIDSFKMRRLVAADAAFMPPVDFAWPISNDRSWLLIPVKTINAWDLHRGRYGYQENVFLAYNRGDIDVFTDSQIAYVKDRGVLVRGMPPLGSPGVGEAFVMFASLPTKLDVTRRHAIARIRPALRGKSPNDLAILPRNMTVPSVQWQNFPSFISGTTLYFIANTGSYLDNKLALYEWKTGSAPKRSSALPARSIAGKAWAYKAGDYQMLRIDAYTGNVLYLSGKHRRLREYSPQKKIISEVALPTEDRRAGTPTLAYSLGTLYASYSPRQQSDGFANQPSMFVLDRAAKKWKPVGNYQICAMSGDQRTILIRDGNGASYLGTR